MKHVTPFCPYYFPAELKDINIYDLWGWKNRRIIKKKFLWINGEEALSSLSFP